MSWWLKRGGAVCRTLTGAALFLSSACGDVAEIEETESPDLALLEEPLERACGLGDAALTSGTCAAEWRYRPYTLEHKADASCGTTNTCAAWQQCTVPVSSDVSTWVEIGSWNNIYTEPGIVIYEPDYEGADKECTRVATKRGGRNGGLSERQDGTPRRYFWRCNVITTVTTNQTVQDSRCPCATYENAVCDVRTGTGAYTLSGPGLSASQLESAVGTDDQRRSRIESKSCLSCDDYPLSPDGSNASGLFGCLESNLNLGSPATANRNRQRMQMLYELFGANLSDAQRATARASYGTLAPQFSACGNGASFTCSANESHRTLLNECSRLASEHVSTALLLTRYDSCMDALAQVATVVGCGAGEAEVGRARALSRRLVDRALSYALPEDTGSGSGPLDAAVRRTYLLGQWWRTASRLAPFETSGEALAESDLNGVLASFWRYVSASSSLDSLRVLASKPDSTEEQLKLGLNQVVDRGMANRVALEALLARPASVRLPLGATARAVTTLLDGEALLQLFVDAAQWNVDRAESLTSAHDLACLFADCAANQPATDLVQFWWLVSRLDQTETPSDKFRTFRAGSLLEQLASFRRGDLRTALAAAASPASDFEGGRARLAALVGRGAARYTNYLTQGLLRGDAARTLNDALNDAGARRIAEFVRQDAAQFVAANGLYRADLKDFLRAVTTDVASGVGVDVAVARRQYYLAKHDELDAQIQSLQAAAARADLTFKDLNAELERIGAVMNRTFTSRVGAAEQLSFQRNRPFLHSGKNGVNIVQLGEMAQWTRPVRAGQMVRVSFNEGGAEHSPTCLLRQIKVAPDHKGIGASIGSVFGDVPPTRSLAPSGTETCGPEGFSMSRQGSDYTVTGVDYSAGVSARAWTGVKYDGCVGGNFLFGSASTCAYGGVEVSVQSSANSTYSHGVNSQTTVALKDGLRSSYAPFPSAPLGALLLVVEAGGKILDVDVATRDGLSTVVPVDANVSLVINDLHCAPQDGTPSLNLTIQTLQTEGNAAKAAVGAIAAVRAKLRARSSHYVSQGLMLPAERSAEQAAAAWELNAQLAALGLTAAGMPPALRDLFDAVVTHEMSRIDRVLEIARLERERALQLEELKVLGHEVRSAAAVNRLNRILPFWTLQDLRTELLESRLDNLLETVREQFVPVLTVWYPEFAADLAREVKERTNPSNAVLRLLDELSPERSLADLSLSVQRAMTDEVLVRFERAQRTRVTVSGYRYLAVSVPNPAHPAHRGRTGPAWQSALSYPTLDEVTSADIWSQIEQGGLAELRIPPELVYGRVGARPGVVDCRVNTPIVRKMILTMVRPGATDIETNNALGYTSLVTAGRDNFIAQQTGLSRFELAPGSWDGMEILVKDAGLAADGRVTVPNDVLQRLLASETSADMAGRDIGISPFGTFTVDFYGWDMRRDWIRRWDPVENDFVPAASELVIVMAIDSRPTVDGQPLPWLATCATARPR